jgi:hypothetical protein
VIEGSNSVHKEAPEFAEPLTMDLPHTEDGSRMDALDSLSTARTVTPWPERLSKPVASDPFFYGNTGKDVPIVIDFGSQRLRAGFSDQSDPFCTYF